MLDAYLQVLLLCLSIYENYWILLNACIICIIIRLDIAIAYVLPVIIHQSAVPAIRVSRVLKIEDSGDSLYQQPEKPHLEILISQYLPSPFPPLDGQLGRLYLPIWLTIKVPHTLYILIALQA